LIVKKRTNEGAGTFFHMKRAFIYTDAYFDYDYGLTHPLKIVRLKLAHELIKACGLLSLPSVQYIPTQKATEEDLALFHGRDYLQALKQASDGHFDQNIYDYGLGPGDNPIFKGVYDWSLWVVGATLQAIDFVTNGDGDVAFNIAGGLHHAQKSRASGFCYINDPVIGITKLLNQGKRVVYLDLDAHHGDGVQWAFYGSDRAMTISFHESGYTLFPGTGFENEIGEGEGEGYSVNVPFLPYADDETYLWAFEEIVPPLIDAFQPDLVVTQLGVDTFFSDPLTKLNLSIYCFERVIHRIKEIAPRWVALGGGGYDISNVARAWSLAWAVMNDVEMEESLPEAYLEKAARLGIYEKELRGKTHPPRYNKREDIERDTERVVHYIKKVVFPKVSVKK
jgi:acetoin utilization protein AcuC